MPYYRGYAPTRKTHIGGLIESFMDDHSEHLSPEMWESLDALGKEVDEQVEELEERISELESEE